MSERPTRAQWTPRQRRKNDAIFFFAALGVKIARSLPRSWLPAVGVVLGHTAYWVFARARAIAGANVARVFPHLTGAARAAFVRRNFIELGRNLTDTIALLDPTEVPRRTLEITPESRTALQAALAEGRGVVYVTCHLGPWERMAALLAESGFPITTAARESYDPRLQLLVYDSLRNKRNVKAIYRGNAGAPIALLRELRRGHVVGFFVDLPSRAASSPTTEILWLGQRTPMPLGPARIALRTGAAVVVGTPARNEDGRRVVRIERMPTDDLAGRPERDEAEAILCKRIAHALSDRVSSLPLEWAWMHPTWGTPDRRSPYLFRLVD